MRSEEFSPFLYEYTDYILFDQPKDSEDPSEKEFVAAFITAADDKHGSLREESESTERPVELMARISHQMTTYAMDHGGSLGEDGPLTAFGVLCYRAFMAGVKLWELGVFVLDENSDENLESEQF